MNINFLIRAQVKMIKWWPFSVYTDTESFYLMFACLRFIDARHIQIVWIHLLKQIDSLLRIEHSFRIEIEQTATE